MHSDNIKKLIYLIVIVIVISVTGMFYFNSRTEPIEYFVLEPRDLRETIVSNGYISSAQIVDIAFETGGIIQDINVNEGDLVKPGDLIITQKHDFEQATVSLLQKQLLTDLNTIREKVSQAEIEVDHKQREFERMEILAESGAISQADLEVAQKDSLLAISNLNIAYQELEDISLQINNPAAQNSSSSDIQLQQARISLEQKKLRSPMEGRVLSIYKQAGEYIQQGEVVIKLASPRLIVVIEMDEKYLLKTKVGQAVLVSPQSDSSTVLKGEISDIGTIVDSGLGTYTIKCTLESLPETFKLNSSVNAEIVVNEEKQVFAVPSEYIRNNSKGPEVILWENGNPTIKPVNVVKNLNNYAIIEGFQQGSIFLNPTQFQSGNKYRLGSTKGSE